MIRPAFEMLDLAPFSEPLFTHLMAQAEVSKAWTISAVRVP